MPGGVRKAILRSATLHHVDAGRVFLDEGERDWAGIVVAGLVRVYLHPSEGHQVAAAHLRPGEAVGVAALVGVDGELVLDFNFAYHPSCVHDPSWSCPLAPQENWLSVPIEVGERVRHTNR